MRKLILSILQTKFPDTNWEVTKLKKGYYGIRWIDGVSAYQVNLELIDLIVGDSDIRGIEYWRGFSESAGRLLFNMVVGLVDECPNPLKLITLDFDRMVWEIDVTNPNFLNNYREMISRE